MSKKRLTKKEKEALERKRKYNRKWAKENADYFKDYFQENKQDYYDRFEVYRHTKKGQETIARYEQSEKRRKAKTEWMRKARAEGRVK